MKLVGFRKPTRHPFKHTSSLITLGDRVGQEHPHFISITASPFQQFCKISRFLVFLQYLGWLFLHFVLDFFHFGDILLVLLLRALLFAAILKMNSLFGALWLLLWRILGGLLSPIHDIWLLGVRIRSLPRGMFIRTLKQLLLFRSLFLFRRAGIRLGWTLVLVIFLPLGLLVDVHFVLFDLGRIIEFLYFFRFALSAACWLGGRGCLLFLLVFVEYVFLVDWVRAGLPFLRCALISSLNYRDQWKEGGERGRGGEEICKGEEQRAGKGEKEMGCMGQSGLNIEYQFNYNHTGIMKYIVSEQQLPIPDGVKVDIKSRNVTVTGPLGKITKSFRHVPFEIKKENLKKTGKEGVKLRMWLQKKKRNATLGTIRSRIRNMITGVTVGYKFRMVLAFAHFPIVVNVIEGGKALEIKNFLGFKVNKRIDAPEGVLITKKEEEKNNVTIQGIDLEKVSQVCARISQSTIIQEKDLRSFLDGIYIQDARLEYAD